MTYQSMALNLAATVLAAAAFAPGSAGADRSVLRADGSDRVNSAITIELHRTDGGQYAVPTSVEGHEPLSFIVDTGANRTAILLPLALQLNLLSQEEHDLVIHGLTASFESRELEVRSVEFGTGRVGPLQTALVPLTTDEQINAYGLLGADAFANQVIALDLEDEELRVGVAPLRRDANNNTHEIDRFGLLRAQADIVGINAHVIIDSGSTHTIANSALLDAMNARRTSSRLNLAGMNPDMVQRADGAFVDWIRVGSLCRRNMHVVRADLEIFETLGFGTEPALIIGLDWLDDMTITVDRHEGVFELAGEYGGSCRMRRLGR